MQTADEIADVVNMTNDGGTYVTADDISEEPSSLIQQSFESMCDSLDIDRSVIERFVEQTAAKNNSSVVAVKDQAVQNWDRFVKALRKFAAKQAETPAKPSSEENGKSKDNGMDVPISFTHEYKELMILKADFPAAYDMARKNTGLKPDSVEACIELIRATKEAVDVMNSEA